MLFAAVVFCFINFRLIFRWLEILIFYNIDELFAQGRRTCRTFHGTLFKNLLLDHHGNWSIVQQIWKFKDTQICYPALSIHIYYSRKGVTELDFSIFAKISRFGFEVTWDAWQCVMSHLSNALHIHCW